MNFRELDKRVIAFATREVWKRKLVQAKRIRCQKCVQIVKLWLKTYGYGPKKYVLRGDVKPPVSLLKWWKVVSSFAPNLGLGLKAKWKVVLWPIT